MTIMQKAIHPVKGNILIMEENEFVSLLGQFYDEYDVYLTDCSVYGRQQMSVDEFYKNEFKQKHVIQNGMV